MMTEPSKARDTSVSAKDKIIVALDVETADEARTIIGEIGNEVGAFKIGLQLFTTAGPAFVRELVDEDIKVFLDLKFHDIPNTVAKASVEAAKLGVSMFNMHAIGGGEMMRAAVDAVNKFCISEKREVPILLGVTVLTSSNATTLTGVGIEREVEEQVISLAKLTAECGMSGVVASPMEVQAVRRAVPSAGFVIVTPGIRADVGTLDDQERVMTPGAAVAAGSDYIVIGRPITVAKDRRAAVAQILEDICLRNK